MKRDEQYYMNLETQSFETFLYEYQRCFDEFRKLMSKMQCVQITAKPISKRLYHLVRQKTIEIEKFGKRFRVLTIEIDKVKNT